MPPKRPSPLRRSETPRMSGGLSVPGTTAPPTTPATSGPSPKRVRRTRRSPTRSPTPGPSNAARTGNQSERLFVHRVPATPTRLSVATIHIGGHPSPTSPDAGDYDGLWISSDHSSVADHVQAVHDTGAGLDIDKARPHKRPKANASRTRDPNVLLPSRLAKLVPLARDEWELSRLILKGAGNESDPLPSIEDEPRTPEDTQYVDDFLRGRPTLYSDRPTDPNELETWKRMWVEEGLGAEIPEFTRLEKAAMQKKDEEEQARLLAEAKEASIDLSQEGPAAIRPRFRPLRKTGPPSFWLEEADCQPEYRTEEVDEDEADRDVGRLRRQGWEWSEDINMDGVKQPPLGVRLEHTLNFLREEDCDRCLGWDAKVKEVEEFLAWVGRTYGMNGEQDGRKAVSAEVRNMYIDALRKLQIHELFEEWQNETAKPALQSPEEALKNVSKRQPEWEVRRDAAAHFRFVPRQQEYGLEPRKLLVAKPRRTNTLYPSGSHEGRVLLTELERAGRQFWEDENSGPEMNLYMVEDAAYRGYNMWKKGQPTMTVKGDGLLPDPEEIRSLNNDNSVDALGKVPVDFARKRDEAQKIDFGPRPKPRWMTDDEYVELTEEVKRLERIQASPVHAMVDTDLDSELDKPHNPILVDDTQIIRDGSSSDESDQHRYTFNTLKRQAEIRGTRRAALQEALRYFTNAPQESAQTKFTTLVPPIEQRYIDTIVKDLDRNHQFSSSSIGQKSSPEDEPMPYTVFWLLHRRHMQKWSETALKEVTAEHAQDSTWVDLPKNLVCGGPFVQKTLDPRAEKDQRLLKQCETALQAIRQGVERNGSHLLSDVYSLAKDVIEDGIDPVLLPDTVILRDDEEYDENGSMSVKLLSPDDVKWMLFMTGRAVNQKMLEPLPGKKLRLYSIFVRRLQKLMDDRSELGLYPKKDSTATVEGLLDVMNAACDGPVERTIFTPFQAKFFLQRASEHGLCTYRPDLLVYGIVGRSEPTIFPWDHIIFNDEAASSDGISKSYPKQDQDTKNQISQIFRNLGYRLGVTIHSLRQSEPTQPEEAIKPRVRLTLPKVVKTLKSCADAYNSTLANTIKNYELSHLQKTGVPRAMSLINLVSNAKLSDTKSPSLHYPARTPSAEAYLRDVDTIKDYNTETSALRHIRRQLILESHHNLPLLSRSRPSFNTTSSGDVILARNTLGYNWDWASLSVRGPVRQFFNVNRWPVNFQTPVTQQRIKSDEEIDERYILDVDAEDPIPKEYFRQKLRRYGEEDEGEMIFRPGTPQFWDGDTVGQQRYVRKLLEERIGDALGISARPPPKPRTWIGRVAAAVTPWKKEREREESPDSPWDKNLPKVHWLFVPKSIDPWDPLVENKLRKSAGLPERRLDDGGDDAEMVDVY